MSDDRESFPAGVDGPSSASRRLILGAAVLALCYPALLTWVYFVVLAGQAAVVQGTAWGLGKAIQFGLPLVWLLAVQWRRSRWNAAGNSGAAGSSSASAGAGVLQGVLFGAIVLAAMLVGYYVWLKPAGALAVAGRSVAAKLAGFGVSGPAAFLALGTFYCLAHSWLEEFYWRWFVFGQLRRLMATWPAIVVSSLGFTAHHVLVLATYFGWASLGTLLFSLAVAVGGAAWAWLYQRSGSLRGPWLSHLLVDAGIFIIGYDLALS